MNSTKYVHELQKKKLESRIEGLEEKDPRPSTADLLHYHYATLTNRKSTTVQAPGSEHAGPGESKNCPTSDKMTAKLRAQVTTSVSINLDKKSCIENRVMSTNTPSRQ